MNRRRIMMAQHKKKHTELEINEKNALLCTIGPRSFYKVNEGLAFCAIIRSHIFWLPLLVSEQKSAVAYTTKPWIGDGSPYTSIEYDGKIYHVSNYGCAMLQTVAIVENPYNLPVLNDVLKKGAYPNNEQGQQQAAKDLLDYYFGKV